MTIHVKTRTNNIVGLTMLFTHDNNFIHFYTQLLYCIIFFLLFYFMQEDVDTFMSKEGGDGAESVLRRLDEQHQKYKFMEYNLLAKKRK